MLKLPTEFYNKFKFKKKKTKKVEEKEEGFHPGPLVSLYKKLKKSGHVWDQFR